MRKSDFTQESDRVVIAMVAKFQEDLEQWGGIGDDDVEVALGMYKIAIEEYRRFVADRIADMNMVNFVRLFGYNK